MIEIVTTTVIRCDGKDCEEAYFDLTEDDHDTVAVFAKRDGWVIQQSEFDEDRHLCPDCASKVTPKQGGAS